MIEVGLNQVDDPDFDVDTAEIVDGNFIVKGMVSLRGGRLYYDERPKPRQTFRERWARKNHNILLRIPGASSFVVDDESGTGQLILTLIEYQGDTIVLIGIIPCIIRVEVSGDPVVKILLEETPVPEGE